MTTTIRETIDTIRDCAAVPTGDHRPIPGERPATAPLILAIAAAEAEPFQALLKAINAFFGTEAGQVYDLLVDDLGASAEIKFIIAEHLDAARGRLHMPAPAVDWADHVALTSALPTIARRAADLRFTEILG